MNIAMTFPDTVDEFMEQYKMTDTECVYSNGIEYVPIFRMEQWFNHLEAKPKTNADRIRSMTDEELAMFLSHDAGWRFECETCKKPNRNKMKDSDCENCWLAWLKEGVKDV